MFHPSRRRSNESANSMAHEVVQAVAPFEGVISQRLWLGISGERRARARLPASGVGSGSLVWHKLDASEQDGDSMALDEECSVSLETDSEPYELVLKRGWTEARFRKSPDGPTLQVWLAAIAAVRAACSSSIEGTGVNAVKLPSPQMPGARDFWTAPEATARHRPARTYDDAASLWAAMRDGQVVLLRATWILARAGYRCIIEPQRCVASMRRVHVVTGTRRARSWRCWRSASPPFEGGWLATTGGSGDVQTRISCSRARSLLTRR